MNSLIGVAVMTALVCHVASQQQPVPSMPNLSAMIPGQVPPSMGPLPSNQPPVQNPTPRQPPFPGQASGPQPQPFPGQVPQNQPFPGQGPHMPPFPGQGPPSLPFPGQGPQTPPFPGQGPQIPPFPGQGPHNPPFPGQGPQTPPFPGQGPQTPPFPGQGPQTVPFPGQGSQNPPFPDQRPINQGQAFPGQSQGFPNQGRFPNNLYPFPQQSIPNQFFFDPFQQNPHAFQAFNQFQPKMNPFQQSINPILQNQMKDSSKLSQFLYCQVANGTMPDWTDTTCQKYWSCTNFNLTLQSCVANQAYSYSTKECVDTAAVQCKEQNAEFWQVLQASIGAAAPQAPNPSFTPLSSLPGGRMNITLEAAACTRLGANLPRLESVTNSALLNLSNCPFNNCNMTLINFTCP